jgi:hypothetical protein
MRIDRRVAFVAGALALFLTAAIWAYDPARGLMARGGPAVG